MSHTATGEWKSFEIRMLHRRAERLVLRADVAADAGCLDDARAFLEEARTLWPAAPGIAEVQHKIDSDSVIPAPAPAVAPPKWNEVPAVLGGGAIQAPAPAVLPTKWKEVAAAGAAVLFVCVALAVLAGTTLHRRLSARDAKAIVDIIEPPTPYAPIERAPQTSAPVDARGSGDTIQQTAATPAVDSPRPIDATRVPGAALRAEAEPTTQVREPVHALAPVPITEPSRASIALPTSTVQSETPAPVPEPAPAPAPPAPAAVSPPGIVATTGMSMPVSPSASIQPPQEMLVRSALARYAKAYSELDVDAAERVWPSVNRSALERAFSSLDSQRVSLGDCRIQIDVATAHASCSGTATWRPKVGGRARTDERHWDFDLVEKAASGWQITSARVQNK